MLYEHPYAKKSSERPTNGLIEHRVERIGVFLNVGEQKLRNASVQVCVLLSKICISVGESIPDCARLRTRRTTIRVTGMENGVRCLISTDLQRRMSGLQGVAVGSE